MTLNLVIRVTIGPTRPCLIESILIIVFRFILSFYYSNEALFLLLQDNEIELSSQSSRTSSPDVADSVVLRHDPQYQNGNSQHSPQRHTLGKFYPQVNLIYYSNNT